MRTGSGPAEGAARAPAPPRHVVFVNWRDSRHPQAGGAELYCESVARRLARQGVRVTLLTSRPPGTAREELVEGVNVRRRGGTFSVYLSALAWLVRRRGSVDAVIDCQNGIPFFTPLVMRRTTPIVCLVFHVHQDQFATYFRWPMDRVGRWLEAPASRAIYGRRSVAVISPSTRDGVRKRLKLRGPVHVVPCGADPPSAEVAHARRTPRPHIVCVGRLVAHKRMRLLIESIPEIAAAHPGLTVAIVGSGPELDALRRQTVELGVGDRVVFHGQVSNRRREQLLSEAWLTVNPSAGEGWGLSVIEANACGVPAVAFRVPGLQDSVLPDRTGWLVDPGADLAPTISAALATLSDPRDAALWSHRAREWAKGFSWDTTTARLLDVVAQEETRLRRQVEPAEAEKRRQSDVACHVSLPADAATPATLASICRSTDVWIRSGDRIEALMPGTDEFGVRCALERLDRAEVAQIRIARPVDWLLGGASLT